MTQAGAASGASGVLDGSSIEDGEAAFTEAVRELRKEYHGALWASTMLWRMIDDYRVHWAADLRLLAGWVSAADELTIILHDTETEHEEPHRTELDRLLLPGQHTPRVGTRLRRIGNGPPPWGNTTVISVADDLAELTASTPTSGLARVVARGFAKLEKGTIWIGMRPADPTPENPWADVHRRVLDG